MRSLIWRWWAFAKKRQINQLYSNNIEIQIANLVEISIMLVQAIMLSFQKFNIRSTKWSVTFYQLAWRVTDTLVINNVLTYKEGNTLW